MTPKERKQHFDRVAGLGCMAVLESQPYCIRSNTLVRAQWHCGAPATIQHCRAGSMKDRGVNRAKGKKSSDWLTVPLCPRHHWQEEGIDGSMGVKTWEAKYGKQADMIDKLCKIFGVDLWALAAELETRKPSQPSKKMVPRSAFV